MKTTKRAWIFLGMTFALSWALCGLAVAHGSLNAFAGMGALSLSGGSDLATSFLGAAGLIALALAILAVFLVDRKSARPVMSMKVGEEYGS